MKTQSKFLISIAAILGLLSSFYSTAKENAPISRDTLKNYLITRVYNESTMSTQLKNSAAHTEIAAYKSQDLTTPLQIPVSSIKNYLQKFVFEENTYVPENALVIKTKAGEFKMWVNEDGIHVCKLETHAQLQQKERLCSHEQITQINGSLKFLLLVDNNGFLKLQPLKR